MLHVDRGDDELEVIRGKARGQPLERVLLRRSEADLASDELERLLRGLRRIACDVLDRLRKAVTGPDRACQKADRLGELLLEPAERSLTLATQPPQRKERAQRTRRDREDQLLQECVRQAEAEGAGDRGSEEEPSRAETAARLRQLVLEKADEDGAPLGRTPLVRYRGDREPELRFDVADGCLDECPEAARQASLAVDQGQPERE